MSRPAIFSVRIAADDPSVLEVIFHGVVTIESVANLTIGQDSGTPPIIESVTGSGTSEHRFGLDPAGSTLLRLHCSAAIDPDIHPRLIVGGSNTIYALTGEHMAAAVVAIGEGALPPIAHIPTTPLRLAPGTIDVPALLADLEIRAAGVAADPTSLGLLIILEYGKYYLSEPLRITPVHGRPRTIAPAAPWGRPGVQFLAGWAPPDVSLADDAANHLISVIGEIDTDLCDSTLATTAPDGALSIRITGDVTATVVAGAHLKVYGNNLTLGDEEYAMSTGPELVQHDIVRVVSASFAGGVTTALLAGATGVRHAAGSTVVGVHPASLEITGVDLACDGGTIAVGVYQRDAIDVQLEVAGAGFSRALIEVETSSHPQQRLYGRGENNSLLFAYASHFGTLDVCTNARDGLRRHPNGIPRALVDFRSVCTRWTIAPLDLSHGVVAVRTWGLEDTEISFIKARDFDGTDLLPVIYGGAEIDPEIGGSFGIAWDGGSGGLGVGPGLVRAAFGRGLVIGSIQATDCYVRSTDFDGMLDRGVVAYMHDGFEAQIGSIQIINRGADPYTVQTDGRYHGATGIDMRDTNGLIGSIDVIGCPIGLSTHNVYARVTVESYRYISAAGVAPPFGAGIILWIDTNGGTGTSPTIRGVQSDGSSQQTIKFGPAFAVNPDYDFAITIDDGGFRAQDARYTQWSPSAVALRGEVRTYFQDLGDPNRRQFGVPAAAGETRACVVVNKSSASDIHQLTANLPPSGPTHVLCTTAEVKYDDLLIVSATAGYLEASANPAEELVMGRALSHKPAGATGLVLVGPA